MIIDEYNLFSETSLNTESLDCSKSIAHDGNEHIHEYDSNQESAKEKHNVAYSLIVSLPVESDVVIGEN